MTSKQGKLEIEVPSLYEKIKINESTPGGEYNKDLRPISPTTLTNMKDSDFKTLELVNCNFINMCIEQKQDENQEPVVFEKTL